MRKYLQGTVLAALVAVGQGEASAQTNADQSGSAITRDQARRAAEAQAANRAAREAEQDAHIAGPAAPALGSFPVETPCFPIKSVSVDGRLPHQLGWVRGYARRFEGRCIGQRGLDHVLRALQAQFLDRGLVTTRAGLPQQALASGTLHIAVVPGVAIRLRGGTRKARRAWRIASPLHKGEIVNLRAIEQGLDQMRRVPGRQVTVDLAPGERPGESVLDLKATPVRPWSISLSANNLAGSTVGRWQATGQASALDLLGLGEIVTAYFNSRVRSPSIPADSRGTGGSIELPFGWWTVGVSASVSHYSQHVLGPLQDFDSRGQLGTVAGTITRVVHRDATSKTSLALQLQRRWARSYVDDIEIRIQHQDLTDAQLTLSDRRRLGRAQLTTELAYRGGIGLFGAQKDAPGLPASLPTARYRVATLDVGLSRPLGERLSYRLAFRGQVSGRALYGADMLLVGGPFTVRGYESDTGVSGRSGWYLRQELSVKVSDRVQPYGLVDTGGVKGERIHPTGVGAGLRAAWGKASIDAFVAIPLIDGDAPARVRRRIGQFGLSAGWSF